MTVLTDKAEIRKIRETGKMLREIFNGVRKHVKEGVSTAELDRLIEAMIFEREALPAFKGYKGYPAASCISVNEVVVHGIPSDGKILRSGDIVSIDVGVKKHGLFADAARTFAVGRISPEAARLLKATEESLREGIDQAVAGNRISDISNAVQKAVGRYGYQEVRTFVGHGIGRQLHEPPEVPNWGERGKGPVMRPGLLLAIEPMVNAGTRKVNVQADGWTAVTADGKLSAHFEHTIMVGEKKAEILT